MTDGTATQHTVRAFLWDAVRSMVSADGRTFRTFRDLLRHPGLLTRAYFDERSSRYIHPLELFLIANLLFFVIGGVTRNHMLTTKLQSQLCCQKHSIRARGMFDRHLNTLRRASWKDARRDTATLVAAPASWKVTDASREQLAAYHGKYTQLFQRAVGRFEAHFDDASDQYARTLVFIMVPLLALIVGLLEIGRGSAVRSIVFSLHFYSFALVLYITSWILGLLVMIATHYELPDIIWGIAILVLQSLYIMLALAGTYGEGWVARILKGGVAGMATLFILQFYRFVLFIVAFYSAI